MTTHPTTQPVAKYLVEASGITPKRVGLVPRSYTNAVNPIANSICAAKGRAWVIEPDKVVYQRVQKLDYVHLCWNDTFAGWAESMPEAHKKIPAVFMDVACTQQDYARAWPFVRDAGTLVGIVHETVVQQLRGWIKAVAAEIEPFPPELEVQHQWRFIRASKTIVGYDYDRPPSRPAIGRRPT